MPRLAMNQITTAGWDFQQDLEQYHSLHVGAIGLWRNKVEDCGEEKALALIKASGLTVNSISGVSGFTLLDGTSLQDDLWEARQAVDLARDLGAEHLVVTSGPQGKFTPRHARRKLFADGLRTLCHYASEHGVNVALQPTSRGPSGRESVVSTIAELREVLDICQHPALGIVLDTFQLATDPTLCDQLESLATVTHFVALSDELPVTQCDPLATREMRRGAPGEGRLPLAEIILALEQAGYRGRYEIQVPTFMRSHGGYEKLLLSSMIQFRQLYASIATTLHDATPATPVPEVSSTVL